MLRQNGSQQQYMHTYFGTMCANRHWSFDLPFLNFGRKAQYSQKGLKHEVIHKRSHWHTHTHVRMRTLPTPAVTQPGERMLLWPAFSFSRGWWCLCRPRLRACRKRGWRLLLFLPLCWNCHGRDARRLLLLLFSDWGDTEGEIRPCSLQLHQYR